MPTLQGLHARMSNKLWSKDGAGVKEHSTSLDTQTTVTVDTEQVGDQGGPGHDASPSDKIETPAASTNTAKEKGRPLAHDIEIRRQTNERLYLAAGAYCSSLSKKKPLPFDMSSTSALEIAMTLAEAKAACTTVFSSSSELVAEAAGEGAKRLATSKDKVVPVEALVWQWQAVPIPIEEVGRGARSNYKRMMLTVCRATLLSHLSAVHLALAQLQESYTSSLSSTLLHRLARSQAAIEALKVTEKAAECAKEKMEAAERRRDKSRGKGEKGEREAQEEARMAKATYEEALDDLETRAEILRDTEQRGPGSGVAIMKEYLSVHLDWVQAQHDVLSRAKLALDQYPTSPPPARATSLKSRVAPPPPPPSAQPLPPRRIVKPPIAGDARHRSTSSPKVPSSMLNGRSSASLSIEDQQNSTPSSSRPISRRQSTSKSARLPFRRSESYTTSEKASEATDSNATTNKPDSNSRRKKLTSIGNTLARSTSSLILPTQGSGSKEGANKENKPGNWAVNLLTKGRDGSKEASYRPMLGDEEVDNDRHRRSLSHVKEASTDSQAVDEDIILTNGFDDHRSSIWVTGADREEESDRHAATAAEGTVDGAIEDTRKELHPPDLQLKPWESFDDKRESLNLGLQLTGNTTASSSESGTPFSAKDGGFSPMHTGLGDSFHATSPLSGVALAHHDADASADDDPAGGLLNPDRPRRG